MKKRKITLREGFYRLWLLLVIISQQMSRSFAESLEEGIQFISEQDEVIMSYLRNVVLAIQAFPWQVVSGIASGVTSVFHATRSTSLRLISWATERWGAILTTPNSTPLTIPTAAPSPCSEPKILSALSTAHKKTRHKKSKTHASRRKKAPPKTLEENQPVEDRQTIPIEGPLIATRPTDSISHSPVIKLHSHPPHQHSHRPRHRGSLIPCEGEFDSEIPPEIQSLFRPVTFWLPRPIITFICETEIACGEKLYLCGGFLRNALARAVITNSDIDLLTTIPIAAFFAKIAPILFPVFGGSLTVELDPKFPVMHLIYPESSEPACVDICSTEGVPLREYSLLRDTPLDAFYASLDPQTAAIQVFDCANGLQDIQQRQVRTIHSSPVEEFARFPERMLRLIRIANELNFCIEAITWEALKEKAQSCGFLIKSGTRLHAIPKLFFRGHAKQALIYLRESHLDQYFLMDSSPEHLDRLASIMPFIDESITRGIPLATRQGLILDLPVSNTSWLLAHFLWSNSLLTRADSERVFYLSEIFRAPIYLTEESQTEINQVWKAWETQKLDYFQECPHRAPSPL